MRLARILITVLGLFLLPVTPAVTEERTWRTPHTFQHQDVEVQLLNWELTRDRKTLLVHAKLRCDSRDPIYFSWRDLFTLQNGTGQSFGSNYDALVDRNGAGLTRTVNEFRLVYREKARITIPFLLDEGDYPFRVVLPDGRPSVLIK